MKLHKSNPMFLSSMCNISTYERFYCLSIAPGPIDFWNVIGSLTKSYSSFFQYLKDKLNVLTVGPGEVGNATVEYSSLETLDGLWKAYNSGHLDKVAQETLVTPEVLEKFGVTEMKLKTFISEDEYKEQKRILMRSSGKCNKQCQQ